MIQFFIRAQHNEKALITLMFNFKAYYNIKSKLLQSKKKELLPYLFLRNPVDEHTIGANFVQIFVIHEGT